MPSGKPIVTVAKCIGFLEPWSQVAEDGADGLGAGALCKSALPCHYEEPMQFSVFVVEQVMAETPLLAHGPLLRWDAAFAVLGKSHAEWLRMGLCYSGERCLAVARWKR
ncbi:hypothetical protein Nepgr_018730 [Nepenthes gracilis]|uniref:Uncharacterized protein n=1 Tax=Nepenthes gracilis TaxID=150966 RepID=A0AAD3XUB1_NEPGR|nr:hypothetical protein Nepgr_018730 [Nepenthes gracilis]